MKILLPNMFGKRNYLIPVCLHTYELDNCKDSKLTDKKDHNGKITSLNMEGLEIKIGDELLFNQIVESIEYGEGKYFVKLFHK